MKLFKKIIISIFIVLCLVGIFFLSKLTVKQIKENALEKETQEFAYLFKNEALKPGEDIIGLQKQTDIQINAALESDNYTFENPYVLENPYHIAPLSAIIIFKTKTLEEIEVSVNGNKTVMEKSKTHSIPVLGLIAGKQNIIELKYKNNSKKITITPEFSEEIEINIIKHAEEKVSDGVYLLTTPLDEGSYGFSNSGDIIWRLTPNFSMSLTPLKNGHFLIGDQDYASFSVSRKGLVEIDFLGKIYNIFDIDGGFHGDVFELESGNLLLISSLYNSDTKYDHIIEIDYKDGKTIKTWNLAKIVNAVSPKFVEDFDGDYWAYVNSVYYDKKTNSIILSVEGRNSVISIDYDTSKINWILGSAEYWGDDFKDYILDYSGTTILGSHTASINSQGNLILFNNNFDGTLLDSECTKNRNLNSSALIIKIEGKTAREINNFDDNKSFYSYAVSSYEELENGNYLVNSSWQFPNKVYSDTSCFMNAVEEGINSTIYEVDKDHNILFKMNVGFGSYMGTKLSLYEKTTKHFKATDLKTHSTVRKTQFKELNLTAVKEELLNAPRGTFSYEVTENLVNINAILPESFELSLVALGEDGKVFEYVIKEKDKYLQPSVNLNNLKGKYALFLKQNKEYFNLDVVYKFGE